MHRITIDAKSKYTSSDGLLDSVFVAARKLHLSSDTGKVTRGTQTATASGAILRTNSIGQQPYIGIINRDSTNTVYIGTGSNEIIQLRPGDVALFRAYGNLYIETTSGTAQVEFIACGSN